MSIKLVLFYKMLTDYSFEELIPIIKSNTPAERKINRGESVYLASSLSL